MKPSIYYFNMKTKILADFQICISVPLRHIYAYELHHCLFIQNNLDAQIQARLEPESPHPLREKLC